MDFFNESVVSLHDQLVNKQLSAAELTKATFANIAKIDPQLQAFLTLNEDAAMKQAQALDEKGIAADQLLAGLPIGIKDNIVTKDLKTTAASKMLANFMPIYDATVVQKLRQAGMINVGK